MSKGETEFVAWLRARYPPHPTVGPLGLWDDMALVPAGGGAVLLSTDMLMDGVDFRCDRHSPEQIGRKALAVGLSDCAAMAVRPVAAAVSLALPNNWTLEQARRLYLGMDPLAAEFSVRIVGGDTNSWNHPLAIDVAVLGEAWPDAEPVLRRGARVGDAVYVTGRLGGSILGRHLAFQPRVHLAHELRRWFGTRLHAMLDVSDGVALDLWRLCEASGVGAELIEERLLIAASPDAERIAAIDGRTVLDHVLADGEDFELLCALDEPDGSAHPVALPRGEDAWALCVGRFVEKGLWLIRPDGRREPLEPRGWQHLT